MKKNLYNVWLIIGFLNFLLNINNIFIAIWLLTNIFILTLACINLLFFNQLKQKEEPSTLMGYILMFYDSSFYCINKLFSKKAIKFIFSKEK